MILKGYGFLLLTSCLGNPERKPLTAAQLRTLIQRIQWSRQPEADGMLTQRHLLQMGYDREMADRILLLLNDTELLRVYVQKGKQLGCEPITRQDPRYPIILRKRLGLESPGCLWVRGDMDLLSQPGISLVGSRDLQLQNREFAVAAGYQAARQSMVLISGNARGADQTGQNACLSVGGKVISVVADALTDHQPQSNVLFVSEEDYDVPFSSLRALRRNQTIHALGEITLVAGSGLHTGGTWSGTTRNLKAGWSKVFCFRDGSPASIELEQLGASLIEIPHLSDYAALAENEYSLFQAMDDKV